MADGNGASGPDDATVASLFKAYDVRGTVPDQLTPEVAYRIGRALVTTMKPEVVAVGRDMRLSGPALAGALIDGIRDQGADAVDLGLVSTDALYFAVGRFGYPAGVMITASHNPAGDNGFKICRQEARALSLDDGLDDIRDAVIADHFTEPDGRGDLTQRDVLDDYAAFVLGQVDTAAIKPLKIAIDAGNGMAGATVPRVFTALPCEVIPLY
ncbi:MAG: phosphomannomutase/phosphoglucomutase, partial [Chloroflexota bacterium]|nr:phosphomannomutase/phosphoglucomutase [Chloroflexota bacterium]